ncbi:MAG: DUF2281 domain-containing protein [Holophagaceae bacterium]|nr:DUF2281 domain-containing protein [Holophagaceae bacterium]
MSTQLTITLDQVAHSQLESYCRSIGSSPSEVVTNFIETLPKLDGIAPDLIIPRTQKPKFTNKDLFGCMKGTFIVPDSFYEPLPDLEDYMP